MIGAESVTTADKIRSLNPSNPSQVVGIFPRGTADHANAAVEVAHAELLSVCRELRDLPELAFEQLVDLSGIDYLDHGRSEWTTESATSTGFSRGVDRASPRDERRSDLRFAVVYHLLSVSRNTRLRLRCYCPAGEPPMPPHSGRRWRSPA